MSAVTHHGRHEAHTAVSAEVEATELFDEDDRAMQIAAAQLRLVTDRRLGKVTPDWVKELAAEEPRSHAS